MFLSTLVCLDESVKPQPFQTWMGDESDFHNMLLCVGTNAQMLGSNTG